MNPSHEKSETTARDVYCFVVAQPPSEWERLVEERCSGQPELKQRVGQLLEVRRGADESLLARVVGELSKERSTATNDGFSETSSESDASFDHSGVTTAYHHSNAQLIRNGEFFGPYRLLEILGEGGMGTVFRARQIAPLERDVALKVLKADLESDEATARFARECRSLALMEHPNIARVFDAGEATGGKHYLVMELIRGLPLDEYCVENDLSVDQRLGLFQDLCRAIQHAHSKGIIHRDLKPRNVLVAEVDGQPLLKVIDFGIAKSLSPAASADLEKTRTGQILGTPLYQAPEQLDESHGAIDFRSDIYALGVVLYKLLTGTKPISQAIAAKAGFDGLMRRLLEQDYDTPSARVARFADHGQASSATSPIIGLPKSRRVQLDWVTLKALRADPETRYQSVTEMSEDVSRYLHHQPVAAGPQQRIIRIRRWSRHHPSAMWLAATALFVLACGLIVAQFWTESPIQKTVADGGAAVDKAEAWRQTSQLQAALAAFRRSDYAALAASLADRKQPATAPAVVNNSTDRSRAERSNIDLFALLGNAAHPKPVAELPNSELIQAADYSSQSKRLLVATKTGELYLQTLTSKPFTGPSKKIGIHPGRVDAVAISADGRLAVSGTESLWFWNLDKAEVTSKKPLFKAGIESIVWSADGEAVAAGSRYEAIWVGDRDGNELWQIPNNHRHEALLFTSDSKRLLVPTRTGIDEYEVKTGRRLRTIDTGPLENIRSMTLAGPDDRYLIIADRFEEFAVVIDFSSGKPAGSFPLDRKYPQCLRTSGDGQTLAALYPDGTCSLIRIPDPESDGLRFGRRISFRLFEPKELADEDRLELLWIDSTTRFLTLGGSHPGRLWDLRRCCATYIQTVDEPAWDIVPGAANRLLAFFSQPRNGGFHMQWMTQTGEGLRPAEDQLYKPRGLLSECSRDHLIASGGEDAIEVIDLAAGRTLVRLECDYVWPRPLISLSEDGSSLAVQQEKQVSVWRTEDRWKTWRRLKPIDVVTDTLLKLSRDGAALFSNQGGRVHEFDTTAGRLVRIYDDASLRAPWKLHVNDEIGLIIVGKVDHMTVFDKAARKPLHQFPVDSEITSFLGSADPLIFLTGHRDGTVRSWHLGTKQPLGILFEPESNLGRISRLEPLAEYKQILAVGELGLDLTSLVIGNPR